MSFAFVTTLLVCVVWTMKKKRKFISRAAHLPSIHSFSLSISLSLFHTHTHTHKHILSLSLSLPPSLQQPHGLYPLFHLSALPTLTCLRFFSLKPSLSVCVFVFLCLFLSLSISLCFCLNLSLSLSLSSPIESFNVHTGSVVLNRGSSLTIQIVKLSWLQLKRASGYLCLRQLKNKTFKKCSNFIHYFRS